MKQLLVAKDVNYAASKTSATTETATNPDLLADGAIGIYGIDDTAGNSNANKLVLITVNTNAAGKVADSDYKGSHIVIAVGTPTGAIVSNAIQKASIESIVGKVYAAAVRQVSHVGFNGTSGSLNLSAFLNGDEGTIGVTSVTLTTQQFPKQNYTTGRIYSNSSVIDVLTSVIVKNQNDDLRIMDLDLLSNGTAANLTNTASVINGSKAVASTAHGLAENDLVRINGNLYKVASVTDANNFVLNRAYQGATNAALANTLISKMTVVTEYGFSLTSTKDGEYFEVSASGIFTQANISYTTPASPGTGAGKQVVALEKNRQAYAGYHDKIDARVKTPPVYALESVNYNLYFVKATNKVANRAEMGVVNAVPLEVGIAFVTGGSNSNQSSFQTIATVLYPATVGI